MIAPHLTRYLLAALLLSKNSQKYGSFTMNNFVNLLQREVTNYSDCLIEFIKYTLIEYDFDLAQVKLKELRKELQKDYFLGDKTDSIINSAQTVFFETYCRIYSGVEIK
jgi:translation initiation factor 3 subunit E